MVRSFRCLTSEILGRSLFQNFRDSENETGSEEELSEETSRFFKKTPINKKQPPSLDLDTTVVCLDSHPSRNVIAAACLDGSIKL